MAPDPVSRFAAMHTDRQTDRLATLMLTMLIESDALIILEIRSVEHGICS